MIILIKKIVYAYQLETIFLVFTLVHFYYEYTYMHTAYTHVRTYAHTHNLHTQVEKDIRPKANLAFTYFYVRLNLSVHNLMLR